MAREGRATGTRPPLRGPPPSSRPRGIGALAQMRAAALDSGGGASGAGGAGATQSASGGPGGGGERRDTATGPFVAAR